MSCCSGGYCNFKFEAGPPLVDNSVSSLNAVYQFLPYGTILEEGEVIRIWMESGQTKVVTIEKKIPLVFTATGPEPKVSDVSDAPLPWQIIALDSGIEYETLIDWEHHPLYNPEEPSVLLRFKHPMVVKPTLKMWFLKLLYKIRTL